jgi:hypothetical protein
MMQKELNLGSCKPLIYGHGAGRLKAMPFQNDLRDDPAKITLTKSMIQLIP